MADSNFRRHNLSAPNNVDADPQNVVSRATALSVIEGPLAKHRDALTLVGGQAVMLRTNDRFGLRTSTSDADFAITPELVSSDPNIEQALRAAGFEPRNPDRPGLWGRSPTIDPVTGRKVWAEMLDIDCPFALSGAVSPKKRSAPLLRSHGKHATNNTPGLELASIDRDLVDVPDLHNPSHSVQMYVGGYAGLICAKSYKIGERTYGTSRDVRPKDYNDLFLLVDTAGPETVAATFRQHSDDAVIGASVRQGQQYFSTLIRDDMVKQSMLAASDGAYPVDVLDGLLEQWRQAFPTSVDW